jgi:diguanylate cyclase (GGDEF)-like protein
LRDPDGRLLYLVENLTSLHGAADLPWLAGRFEFLGEHAIGAALTALVLPDDAGVWRAAASASPRPAYVRDLWEALEIDALASNAAITTALEGAENSPAPITVTTTDIFGERADGTLETTILAPISFNREAIGVGMFLAHEPDAMTETIAGVVASHAAVAIYQLRERQDARRLHSVDPRLWVPDENFLVAQLTREVARSRRYDRELGVAVIRLENESAVRFKFGDFYTDHLMRRVGGHLLASVRDTDVLGALGDGYAVLHTETGAEGTNVSAHRLREGVLKMIQQRFPEAPAPQISSRTATYPANGQTVEELIAHLSSDVNDARAA